MCLLLNNGQIGYKEVIFDDYWWLWLTNLEWFLHFVLEFYQTVYKQSRKSMRTQSNFTWFGPKRCLHPRETFHWSTKSFQKNKTIMRNKIHSVTLFFTQERTLLSCSHFLCWPLWFFSFNSKALKTLVVSYLYVCVADVTTNSLSESMSSKAYPTTSAELIDFYSSCWLQLGLVTIFFQCSYTFMVYLAFL